MAFGGARARLRGAAWSAAGVLLGFAACGGPAKEGGPGADCFRATECQAGLVCIDHKCTNDVSSVDIHPEAGPGAGAGGAPMDDGGASGPGGSAGTTATTGSGGSAGSATTATTGVTTATTGAGGSQGTGGAPGTGGQGTDASSD
jgi:hypothetical protein